MKARSVVAAALALSLSALLAAQSAPAPSTAPVAAAKPEPYRAEEFPPWALDLRRAEAVAFGSLPFTVFFAQFSLDSYRFSQNEWDRRYAPWPFKAAGAVPMTEQEFIASFAAGCVGAVAVALVDYLIVSLKRRGAREADEVRAKPAFRIERTRADAAAPDVGSAAASAPVPADAASAPSTPEAAPVPDAAPPVAGP